MEDQAFWRLHLGTSDEARFPEITLNLRNDRAAALEAAILAVMEGDIIRVTNPPVWLPGGPYELLVEAIREEKRSEEHTSELQSLMRISYAVFCLKKKIYTQSTNRTQQQIINSILQQHYTKQYDN